MRACRVGTRELRIDVQSPFQGLPGLGLAIQSQQRKCQVIVVFGQRRIRVGGHVAELPEGGIGLAQPEVYVAECVGRRERLPRCFAGLFLNIVNRLPASNARS